MTKAEKIHFIRELCESTCATAIERVDRMPEEWDGHELRLYLSQLFADNVSATMSQKSKRGRDYQNAVLVNSL